MTALTPDELAELRAWPLLRRARRTGGEVMAIITDGVHLVSTVSEQELHTFAIRMGLDPKWYQKHAMHPHYDLTTKKALGRALWHGAEKVTSQYLILNAWWADTNPVSKRIRAALSEGDEKR